MNKYNIDFFYMHLFTMRGQCVLNQSSNQDAHYSCPILILVKKGSLMSICALVLSPKAQLPMISSVRRWNKLNQRLIGACNRPPGFQFDI